MNFGKIADPKRVKSVEAEEIYDMNMSSTFLSLQYLLNLFSSSSEPNQAVRDDLYELLTSILAKPVFWSLSSSKNSTLRTSFLSLLEFLIQSSSGLFPFPPSSFFLLLLSSLILACIGYSFSYSLLSSNLLSGIPDFSHCLQIPLPPLFSPSYAILPSFSITSLAYPPLICFQPLPVDIFRPISLLHAALFNEGEKEEVGGRG